MTKSGTIKIEGYNISYYTKTYQFADAWTDFYNCQSGEVGALKAIEYATELIRQRQ